jgi:hypothetical protein
MGREIIGPQRISRFLFQSKHFHREKNVVKARAFIPPDDRELSVAYTDQLSEQKILEMAKQVLSKIRARNPNINYYGRGDFLASEVLAAISKLPCHEKNQLKIIKDDEGFPGHTTITGWPADHSICELFAGVIASCSQLRLMQ